MRQRLSTIQLGAVHCHLLLARPDDASVTHELVPRVGEIERRHTRSVGSIARAVFATAHTAQRLAIHRPARRARSLHCGSVESVVVCVITLAPTRLRRRHQARCGASTGCQPTAHDRAQCHALLTLMKSDARGSAGREGSERGGDGSPCRRGEAARVCEGQ